MASYNSTFLGQDDHRGYVAYGAEKIPSQSTCPIGLQYLLPLGAVYIKQEIEPDLALQTEMNNKYNLLNSDGKIIYRAQDNTGYWNLNCSCSPGSSRPFNITMFDVNNSCITYQCPTTGFLQVVTAIDPSGELLGQVSRTRNCCCCPCSSAFEVQDVEGRPILLIKSPGGFVAGRRTAKFPIFEMDGKTEVGHILKSWSGYVQEAFMEADDFMISFPFDLDVRIKAVLIAGCFLIDFIYFERRQQRDHDRGHRRRWS